MYAFCVAQHHRNISMGYTQLLCALKSVLQNNSSTMGDANDEAPICIRRTEARRAIRVNGPSFLLPLSSSFVFDAVMHFED